MFVKLSEESNEVERIKYLGAAKADFTKAINLADDGLIKAKALLRRAQATFALYPRDLQAVAKAKEDLVQGRAFLPLMSTGKKGGNEKAIERKILDFLGKVEREAGKICAGFYE